MKKIGNNKGCWKRVISLGRVSGEIFFAVKRAKNGQKRGVFKNKSQIVQKSGV